MSQENVEAFNRFTAAQNRRDFEAMLDELDPEVEWHSAIFGSMGGEAAVFRGHDGVRTMLRDLGDRLLRLRTGPRSRGAAGVARAAGSPSRCV